MPRKKKPNFENKQPKRKKKKTYFLLLFLAIIMTIAAVGFLIRSPYQAVERYNTTEEYTVEVNKTVSHNPMPRRVCDETKCWNETFTPADDVATFTEVRVREVERERTVTKYESFWAKVFGKRSG